MPLTMMIWAHISIIMDIIPGRSMVFLAFISIDLILKIIQITITPDILNKH